MTLFYLFSIVLLFIAWTMAFLQEARDLVNEFRHQFRLYVIQRVGNLAVQELTQQLRAEVEQVAIPSEITDQIIEEERQVIIDRIGNKYAREILDD